MTDNTLYPLDGNELILEMSVYPCTSKHGLNYSMNRKMMSPYLNQKQH